jgi:uncharacterized protein
MASGSTPVEVLIGGDPVDAQDLLAMNVERDLGQPDMAAIVLSNQNAKWSIKAKMGAAVVIKAGDKTAKTIYSGEVVGLEGLYKGGEKSTLTIRAMNKLHRLLRKRQSVTYVDKSDKQILEQIAKTAELTLEWKHETEITYKHVYQHNQTDLEFLRMRAGRMGCFVWCTDTKLFVQQPQLDQSPVDTINLGESNRESAIKEFRPRISSAAIVKKVTVKGWNPEKKELITGEATIQSSKLGKENSVDGSGGLGKEETFMVDLPLWDKAEATALAKARLSDLSLSFMTGECVLAGVPEKEFELGSIAKIVATAESNSAEDPFNGNYVVVGISAHYVASKTKEGGYTTTLRLARDAQKQKG